LGVFIVSGCATGTGRTVASQLLSHGDVVIGIDEHDADIVADLSTSEGCAAAIEVVLDRAHGSLDGAVIATGLTPLPRLLAGGQPGIDQQVLDHLACQQIANLYYRSVIDLLSALRPAFAAVHQARVVVCIGATKMTAPESLIRALLAGNMAAALDHTSRLGARGRQLIEAACNYAVVRWVQREAISAGWGGKGISLAALTPLAAPPAEWPATLPAFGTSTPRGMATSVPPTSTSSTRWQSTLSLRARLTADTPNGGDLEADRVFDMLFPVVDTARKRPAMTDFDVPATAQSVWDADAGDELEDLEGHQISYGRHFQPARYPFVLPR
jgi:NAD(P)-dependent dehydrogenase (short-subunit alcohol dehydrogenase family)